MTGPTGNSEFCFPSTHKALGNIKGFPWGLSLSAYRFMFLLTIFALTLHQDEPFRLNYARN